jgi:hypothetical protein
VLDDEYPESLIGCDSLEGSNVDFDDASETSGGCELIVVLGERAWSRSGFCIGVSPKTSMLPNVSDLCGGATSFLRLSSTSIGPNITIVFPSGLVA